jgi:hypothetical protein
MNQFIITGYKLKVAGDDPDVGIYFEQVGGTLKLPGVRGKADPGRKCRTECGILTMYPF